MEWTTKKRLTFRNGTSSNAHCFPPQIANLNMTSATPLRALSIHRLLGTHAAMKKLDIFPRFFLFFLENLLSIFFCDPGRGLERGAAG